MEIWALCPISGSNDSRNAPHFYKLGTVHPNGINERFPLFNSLCLCLSKAYIDIAWKQTYVSPALKFAGRRKGRNVGLMKMLSKSPSAHFVLINDDDWHIYM
jgi:hypothetical protein